MIFDYLFCQHNPDRVYRDSVPTITSRCDHDLDYLSATSRVLRAELNDWAIHFLTSYANFQMPKSTNKARTFNMLRGTKGLLTWAKSHCIFCGKKSSRRAILMNGFKCCHKCDRVYWPDKITKTRAWTEYQIREYQLLGRERRDVPLPKIRYGTYLCVNVHTTVFERKDVERVATALHGDLKAYFAKRKADKEERERKARKERKKLPGYRPDYPIIFDD